MEVVRARIISTRQRAPTRAAGLLYIAKLKAHEDDNSRVMISGIYLMY